MLEFEMFNFIDKLRGPKVTSLEDEIEKKAYLEEKLKQAEVIGKAKAKAEMKEELKEVKKKPKAKSGFSKFQDYATDFTKRQSKGNSIVGDMKLGFGGDTIGRSKKGSKRSRKRIIPGFYRG